MNFLPQPSWFLIVGAWSGGELRTPLAADTKRLKIVLSGVYSYLVANLSGDEELLHCHGVHGWEVVGNSLMAFGAHFIGAEVLLEVDSKLGCHDWVLQVSLHPLKTLDALFTSVPGGQN